MLWFSWINVISLRGKSWTTYMQLITSLCSFWPIKYADFIFWWLSMVSMVFCLLFQAYQSGDSWLASPPPIEPSITSIISVAIPKFLDVSFAHIILGILPQVSCVLPFEEKQQFKDTYKFALHAFGPSVKVRPYSKKKKCESETGFNNNNFCNCNCETYLFVVLCGD